MTDKQRDRQPDRQSQLLTIIDSQARRGNQYTAAPAQPIKQRLSLDSMTNR